MRNLGLIIGLLCSFCSDAFTQTENYFQQEVNYKIDVRLDDEQHILRGFESFEYFNNSPDELTEIYIHLWPNAYKNKNTALAKQLIKMGNTSMYFATEDELGYIDSLKFKVDGVDVEYQLDPEHIDICTIRLPKPLNPGESILVSTPFKVKVPSGKLSRLGHVGQSYQITQWYPKPAVYDLEGWHAMPYLTQGEFFSEYGSFEVSITLPKNYVVGATGDIQTPSEIAWIDRKVKEDSLWIADRLENEDWKEFNDNAFPESDSSFKTITFKQSKVHDFAWFADKRFKILKGVVQLPESKNKIDVYTMFTPRSAKYWSKSIEYMHDAIYYYSLWNGDYPYKHATAVDGTISAGGGMEYPNVTVIGSTRDDLMLETVIMHEVGHNWFYGILGSNERRYAWLDEGLNSYNEQRYLETKYPNKPLFGEEKNPLIKFAGFNKYAPKDMHYFTYLLSSRVNIDQPLDVHSAEFSSLNYGAMVYSKSAVFLNYLRSSIGDVAMDDAMHSYFDQFKFKHPYPQDFENVLESQTSQNLDWFFRDIVEGSKELDYKLRKAKSQNDTTYLKIKNKTSVSGPVSIGLISKDDSMKQVWIDGFEKDTSVALAGQSYKVKIDPQGVMPEINRKNNTSRTKGIFKRTEPLSIKFAGAIEDPSKNTAFFIPAVGWNSPTGFMLGASVYNSILPTKRFNYQLLMMYGVKSNSPVGALNVNYIIPTSRSLIESVNLGVRGKSYAHYYSPFQDLLVQYMRAEPYIDFRIRPSDYASMWRHTFTLSSVLTKEVLRQVSGYRQLRGLNYFNRATLSSEFSHPIYMSNSEVMLEQHADFARLNFEWNTAARLTEKIKLDTRVFGGAFLYNNSVDASYNYRMDGQSNINQTDYAFDAELLGRDGNTFFANQLTNTHGGFKVPTANGQSNNYLFAANLELSYGRIPFGIFSDIGHSSSSNFIANAGLYAKITDVIKIYLPLVYTNNINQEVDANGSKWYELIRFQLKLEDLNFLEKAKRLKL